MAVIKNQIKRRLHLYCKGDLDRVDELKEMIEYRLYRGHHKKWMRILNNYSQPTLDEAAFIAYALETNIESLFEFDFMVE